MTGGTIVMLNIISKSPRMRCTTKRFICLFVFSAGKIQINDTPT